MIKRIKELKIHLAVITFLFGVFFGINISGQSQCGRRTGA